MYHYKIKKRKRRASKGVIIGIIILFLSVGAAYVLFLSPIFSVKAVEISGNKELNAEDIISNIRDRNILLITQNKLKNELMQKFPKISEFKTTKNIFKGKLKIEIQEREEIGIVCQAEKCFYFDNNGVAFESAPQTSGSLITTIKDNSQKNIRPGDKFIEPSLIDSVLKIKEDLFSLVGLKIVDFEISDFPAQELKAMTDEGWYILFDSQGDTEKQLLVLKTVLDDKIKDRSRLEYVDLTIENRVYYK